MSTSADFDSHNTETRPSDYWDLPDPVAATIVNICGQRRRRLVHEILTTGQPEFSEAMDTALREPVIGRFGVRYLVGWHPTWLGGEELPDFLPGEIEIARVVLATPTLHVISIRARRDACGTILRRSFWRYRMLDEKDNRWAIMPAQSANCLTLPALAALIDTASCDSYPDDGRTLADRLRSGMNPEEGEMFVQVESLQYPEIGEHFAEQARQWAERQRLGVLDDPDSQWS